MTAITLVLNKPYGTVCQFSREPGSHKPTLADWVSVADVYPAGRLDADSEGLLLLTNDGSLQARVTQPGSRRGGKLWKRYLVQVDGAVTEQAIQALQSGVVLKDGPTRPAKVQTVPEPDWLWQREPPIRVRKSVPTSWLQIDLNEGRNRQVRRMTAAVGFPTLRLIRQSIGPVGLDGLQPGESRALDADEVRQLWQARR